jgi:putative peptidoglycan lipid II flippase
MTSDGPGDDRGHPQVHHEGREQQGEQEELLASSAVMAAGTVVSRFSGYVRSLLLAAALGNLLHADLFTIGNTVPNMLYILLAGGVFNAVLVPQLVRSMGADPDGGEAYTNRVITLSALFLGAVSVVLVVAAPWVMDVFLSSQYDCPELADQRESIVAFARFCLPQVFFYGMFALVGQVLNARQRFGPMMWAPIANNLVSVAVLVAYLARYGPVHDDALSSAYSPTQEAWLGLGATAGIAVQLLVLVPFLRAAGIHYRPRFDFRGTGLGHTLRLGVWTVLFVVVNQIAYAVVVRLASGGTAQAVAGCGGDGGLAVQATGYTVYAQTFLIVMVPHAVITVSLATAMLPLLSSLGSAGDLPALGASLARVLRTALAVVVPFAVLLPVIAPDLAAILWDWGAASSTYTLYILSLSLFGAGVVFFTVHYLVLRGFYALERTRTVFLIQCAVAATNVVAAVVLVASTDAEHTAPALVLAYTASYVVGSALSYLALRRTLARGAGGLATATLVRFLVRLAIAAGVATFAAWGVATLLPGDDDPGHLLALARLALAAGADVLVFVVLARLMRLAEVTEVLDTVTRRLRRRLAPR